MAHIERHLFVILLWISMAVSFGAHALTAPNNLVAAIATITVLGAWLHLIHRVHRWTNHDSTEYLLATAGLLVGFVLLVALDASYLFALFGIYSFIFGFSDEPRRAAILSAILTALWVGAWLYHGLPVGAIATPVFVWSIANAINVLSTRISVQNTERGELIERLETTRAELAEAERDKGVLEERSRLAREIHDTLAQGFTSVVLLSEAMRSQLDTLDATRIDSSLELIATTARQNLDDARRLVAADIPVELDGRSLYGALTMLAESISSRTDSTATIDADESTVFGPSHEVVMLRVAQEACNNAAKHANASNIAIAVTDSGSHAVLTISDDGDGFDTADSTPNMVAGTVGGSGLGFMAERVAQVNGELTVNSTPGGGTTIRATIPLVSATGVTQ